MRKNGLVSVVIATYNAAAYIEETIESVLAQSYAPIEIIVIDDGSKDDTAAVVAKFGSRVTLVVQANSGGPSSPRNHGLRLAKGEFVAFFDADDLMFVDKIERQVAFLRAHTDVSVVLTDYRNFSETGDDERTHFDSCVLLRQAIAQQARETSIGTATATSILISENFGITGSLMFRRSWFDQHDAFDEALMYGEDFEIVYRAASTGSLGIIDEVGYRRRIHGANISLQKGRILQYKLASRRKVMSTEPAQENRRQLRTVIANYHMSLAEFFSRDGQSPSLIWRHTWAALRLGHVYPARTAKNVARWAVVGLTGTRRNA